MNYLAVISAAVLKLILVAYLRRNGHFYNVIKVMKGRLKEKHKC